MNPRSTWRDHSIAIRDGRGPERVSVETPPPGWTPPKPAGFVPPKREVDPEVWNGDDS
jgi:hypothetical protein